MWIGIPILLFRQFQTLEKVLDSNRNQLMCSDFFLIFSKLYKLYESGKLWAMKLEFGALMD